jgi:excisionase family DNA binding protein
MEIKLPEIAELVKAVHLLTQEVQSLKKLIKPKDAYTREEAAEVLGVSTRTISNYIIDGTLEGIQTKKRGRVIIPVASVQRFLQEVKAA